MTKSYFNLLCILIVCSAINIEILKKQTLDNLKLFPDYTHHFVFFDEQTLNDIRPLLERWASDTDVKFYLNDCRGNKLPECDNPKQTPLLLIFNKILIRCNAEQTKIEEISDWIESRIVTSPVIVDGQEKMNEIISQSPNWFCFATNQTAAEGQAMFYALTKTMPFLNFCVIKNQAYFNKIGLKAGNVTYIKGNATQRVEYEYATRLDGWQWFVKNNLLHTIPRSQSLVGERFAQKQKNISVSLVTCDFSFRCEKVWQKVKNLEKQLSPEALGFNFSIAIQDQKESFTFNLYYHLTFDLRKVPAFAHINLNSDGEAAGKLVRNVEYTDKDFTVAKLKDFRERVSRGEVEPFYFSDQIPKKNGFTGKGSEKFVQKVVAKNIREVISTSPNHYILLFSTVNIGCTSCETFYKQYKQVAALLVDKDVTFGFFDVNRNEIDFQQITNLPQILLFKKDNKEKPIRMPISHNFQHLRGFIKDYLGDQYFNLDQL